jgi:Flp pilus assembly protein TadD
MRHLPPRLAYPACVALAGALLLVAYANHFQNGFHFDDDHTVVANLYLRDLRNVPLFFRDARTFSSLPANQVYRPVVTTTLALDYRLGGGLAPFAFHLDAFLLLLAQCGLLVVLFRPLLDAAGPQRWTRWLALFGAALFGLHTAIAETVNYVIARSDILSTLGVVGALAIWTAWPRGRRTGAYLLPAVAGILAKEQAAMMAPILFAEVALLEQQQSLPDLLRPRRLWQALKPALPAFVICAATLLLAMRMAPGWSGGGASRLHYALTQPYALLRYAAVFVVPLGLSADHDWTPVTGPGDVRLWLGLAFLAALGWAAVRASRHPSTRPAAFGLVWFVLALLPTSSVVPLAEVVNDHRMFFPFVGLALAAANLLGVAAARLGPHSPLPGRERARERVGIPWLAAGAIALLLAHAAGVHVRNRAWRDDASLWRDVTEKSPGNARGWMNYGVALMAQNRLVEAERCLERGLVLAPYYGYLHINLGVVEGALGRPERAERHFRLGLAYAPGVPSLRTYFARWLHGVGRREEAEAQLRVAVAGAPNDPAPRLLLMRILAELGRWDELERIAREALRLDPGDAAARRWLERAREAGASSGR